MHAYGYFINLRKILRVSKIYTTNKLKRAQFPIEIKWFKYMRIFYAERRVKKANAIIQFQSGLVIYRPLTRQLNRTVVLDERQRTQKCTHTHSNGHTHSHIHTVFVNLYDGLDISGGNRRDVLTIREVFANRPSTYAINVNIN